MNKRLLTLSSLILIFSAGCQKDDLKTTEPKEELVTVKFTAENFDKTIAPFGLLSSTTGKNSAFAERAKITTLVLMVYDEYNRLVVKRENYTATNSYLPIEGSLKFNLELPKGNYKVGLLGHNRQNGGGLEVAFDEREYDNHQLRVDGAVSGQFDLNIVFIRDAYYYPYKDIAIQSDTTFAPFKMERLTSRLDLEILDEIPSEVSTILVGGFIPMSIFPFSETKESISRDGYVRFGVDQYAGQKNVVLSSPIYGRFNSSNKNQKLSISMWDKNNKFIASKAVSDVRFEPNSITKLSGNLFSDMTGKNSAVSLRADLISGDKIGSSK